MRTGSAFRALRSPLAVITIVLLCCWLGAAVLAPPVLSDSAGHIDVSAMQQGMSAAHPFGTDQLGRDILGRVLVATRLSLWLAMVTTAIGALFGTTIGVLPVVVGRRVGRLIVA